MVFVHWQTCGKRSKHQYTPRRQADTGCGSPFTLSCPHLQFQQEVIRANGSSQVKPIPASALHHSVRQQLVFIYTTE